MESILFPYLTAMVVTVAVLTAGAFAYVRFQRAAQVHMTKSQRLPDFLQWVELGEDVAKLEERRSELREQEAAALAAIDQAHEAREFLEQNAAAVKDAEHAVEQLRQAESDLVTAQEKLGQEREELRKSEQARQAAEFDREQQEKLTGALRSEHEKLEKSLEQAKSDVREYDELRRQTITETESVLTEASRLKAEVAGLEARRNQLQQELPILEARQSEMNTTVAQKENILQELTAKEELLVDKVGPVASGHANERLADLLRSQFEGETLGSTHQDLEEPRALEIVRRHVEAHGLRFHERVINAFHTALKTQDESPLIVLAGISGTGKSLLPQRYAEALGMHSLVVPVQPRWDGPQDLLGFYHHLEGQFKATPLSRALLQFDPYAQERGNSEDLSSRMLLVLLDEMNLARVEYYFSEFLSRLEIRREVDMSGEGGRRRAGIPLEIGSKGEEESLLSLTVDRNVLFVGTINEDESTQTLSDKVVDRANVIRFGRPNELAGQNRNEKASVQARALHLPFATWDRWIEAAAPLSGKEATRIESVARELNDALERIGKPFGHRTYRAMRAYCQHYPARTNHMEWALSDQVEQRILPKLRGTDPEDEAGSRAIEGVLQVVTDLKDEVLADAIEKGRQGHTFLWQGVERSE